MAYAQMISAKGALFPHDYRERVGRQTGLQEVGPAVSGPAAREKMPGIHVHTLSPVDWIDEEKESLLTVPGSYWLCHKKNIYKFIFKYHRTAK